MAVIQAKIKEIIFKCIKELKDNNIPIDEVYLFGSYAKAN